MKKLLLLLVVPLMAALIGALGYVVFMMDDKPAVPPGEAVEVLAGESSAAGQQTPKLDVKKKAQTDAEVLEALHYERSQNRDTVGWLIVPNTDINASVLQSHDNTTYLRKNERKQEDLYGCYFADYECSLGDRAGLSPNTVIYGHSDLKDNPDGPRFSQLFRFLDQKFAEQNPCIRFSTMQEQMDWQIFAVYYTDVSFPYIQAEMTGDTLVALTSEAMQKSIYDYGVPVGGEDKILTLSTCTIRYGEEDTSHRFVVMAKLLPKEAEPPKSIPLENRSDNR